MEWSKIKNIVLIILLLTNLSLLTFVLRRDFQDRAAQTQALENALEFLSEKKVEIDRALLPKETLSLMKMERDREQESQLAAALLGGDVTEQARGGEVYRYSGSAGSVQFHRDGVFQAAFVQGAFPLEGALPEEHAVATLAKLDYQAQVVSATTDGSGKVTLVLRQLWQDTPVFDCQVTLTYAQDCLISMTGGRRLVGEPTSGSGKVISVPTALFRFYQGMNTLGDVCRTIQEIQKGYVTGSGGETLTPVWYISTDTRDYLLDMVTGELSRVESGEQTT